MRKTLSLAAVTALAVPLLAAIPASRVKEPNAVFAFTVDPATNRLQAEIFDRAKHRALDHLDVTLDYPPYGIGDMNDAVQFSAATRKVYVGSVEAGSGVTRIAEGNFAWKDPVDVFSCIGCRVTGWIVHPTAPKLYVAIEDPHAGGDEFRNAKLAEITLSPILRTRVIGRVPTTGGLAFTPDGSTIYVFGEANNSDPPYGELVSIDLSDRHRVKTVVNLPRHDVYTDRLHATTRNVSPDMREMVYANTVIDLRTKKSATVLETGPYVTTNGTIAWSRDSGDVIFPLQQDKGDQTVAEDGKVFVDRATKETWTLPLPDSTILDWAPAQTAVLFEKAGDIGFYDLRAREWVHVLEGTPGGIADGSWATLPTKKVPRR